jgi:hypothetical protein
MRVEPSVKTQPLWNANQKRLNIEFPHHDSVLVHIWPSNISIPSLFKTSEGVINTCIQ